MDQPSRSLFLLNGSFGSNENDFDGTPVGVDGVPINSENLDGVPWKRIDLDGVPLCADGIDGMSSKFVSMLLDVTSNRRTGALVC